LQHLIISRTQWSDFFPYPGFARQRRAIFKETFFMATTYFPASYRSAYPAAPGSLYVRAWLPVALFATIFAIESTASLGVDHTSAPLHAAWHFFFGPDPAVGWSYTHHILRKIGHFSGYGALSLMCFRAFWLTLRNTSSQIQRRLGSHGLAIAATFCVAGADEIHQSFLPNRTGLFSDVLLDTAGATALQLLLFALLTSIPYMRRHSESATNPWETELRHWSPRSFRLALKNLGPRRTRVARVRRLPALLNA
jgi:VanZ family protein